MEGLRLLDRRWRAKYSARRLGEFVAQCHERGVAVAAQRFAVIPALFASAPPQRGALLAKNSECDSRAEGAFALVKRRTSQSPDHYLSPSHSRPVSRAAEPKKNNQQSAESHLFFAKVNLSVCVTRSRNAPGQDASIASPCDRQANYDMRPDGALWKGAGTISRNQGEGGIYGRPGYCSDGSSAAPRRFRRQP
jgi:hypothetical protein